MSGWNQPATPEKPSPYYLLTLSLGCIGLAFIGIGLGGALIGRAGGDPIRAINTTGTVMLLVGFAVAFSMRLIFWQKSPPTLRSAVRAIITALFVVSIPVAFLGLYLALQLSPSLKHNSAPVYFSSLALLCQIGTAVWLIRYRREGL